MKKILSALGPFKIPLVTLLIVVIVLMVANLALPDGGKEEAETETEIVAIEAECGSTYNNINEISINDITVKAIHEDDTETTLEEGTYVMDMSDSKPVGETVTVKLILVDNRDITCECEISIRREKIMGFQCGYPEVTDVIAVLYSNGELAFEGKGDVLVFYEGDQPWLNYEESDELPIVSVSFESTVTPTDMNYWFEDLETLVYCEPIPSSVRTMVRTFEGCTGLVATADWSKADSLLNINGVYRDCTQLMATHPIPQRVRIAREAFAGCTELQISPDMTYAESLVNTTGMFAECGKLINTTIPANATDITGMYEDCINLKQMPEIPESVIVMSDCFRGDISLTAMTRIPANVQDVSGAFDGCEMITGDLVVEANPEDYGNMFSGACLATKVNLTGTSLMLDVLANTSDTGNVYVNKAKPNPNLTSYSDVFTND